MQNVRQIMRFNIETALWEEKRMETNVLPFHLYWLLSIIRADAFK